MKAGLANLEHKRLVDDGLETQRVRVDDGEVEGGVALEISLMGMCAPSPSSATEVHCLLCMLAIFMSYKYVISIYNILSQCYYATVYSIISDYVYITIDCYTMDCIL